MHACKKESSTNRSRLARSFLILGIAFIVLALITGSIALSAVQKKAFIQDSGKLQIPFIANQGQIEDERVKYYTQTFSGPAYVTENGDIGYRFSSAISPTSKPDRSWSLKESFISAAHPIPQGINKSPTRVNYFKGADKSKWKVNVPTYDDISLGEIYPGIILSLKAHGKKIEKIFTIEPGSDPAKISVRIDGAKKIGVNNERELVIENGSDHIRFSRPIAYQLKKDRRIPVQVTYSIKAHTYGFKVGKYDHSLPLIIDPTMSYSTLLGGADTDASTSVSVDNSQIAFIAGETSSFNLATSGVYQSTKALGSDAFVAGISADGASTVFVTYLGGNGFDRASDIIIK